ncbi:hypothetical protein CHUAL_003736 [Chamberlinius hualienensis]
MMDEIEISKCDASSGIKVHRLCYKQNGIAKMWDTVSSTKTISILVFNITKKVFVFVRQFNPITYYNALPKEAKMVNKVDVNQYPVCQGWSLDVITRLVDKNMPLTDLAKEELLEKYGYDVPVSAFHKVISYKRGVTHSTFYVEVSDELKINFKEDDLAKNDLMETAEMHLQELRSYINESEITSSSVFLFLAYWFLENHAAKYEEMESN